MEHVLHLLLEQHDVVVAAAGDHKMIDIHTDNEPMFAGASLIHSMLGGAPLEAEGDKRRV